MGEKRYGSSDVKAPVGCMEREVSKHGRAAWQGYEISFGEAGRGPPDHELIKKPVRPDEVKLPHSSLLLRLPNWSLVLLYDQGHSGICHQ